MPHASHIDVPPPPGLTQIAPDAVQVIPTPPPPQQVWLRAPQVPHDPFMHIPAVPLPVHVEPAPMQQRQA